MPNIILKLVLLSLISLIPAAQAIDPSTQLQVGLPDGIYVIERRLPSKPTITFQDERLQTAIQLNTPHETGSPYSAFFELILRGNDFVIQQMLKEQEELIPNGIFFASSSAKGSWAFLQKANQITILPPSTTGDDDEGPISGALGSARSFAHELRNMGLHLINWSSIKVIEDDNVTGSLSTGSSFTGRITRDANGILQGLTYRLIDASEYNITIAYSDYIVIETSVRKRNPESGLWKPLLDYRVHKASPIPQDLDMMSSWRTYENPETKILFYNPETQSLTYNTTSGQTREVVDYTHINQQGSKKLMWIFITAFVIASTIPIVIALRLRRR